ncbi:MAG: SET domain-containing protein-lysine N-methyltransferase [Candidatus Omnitrophica bacterium]|nr:SET domain-containing protein-lysine N-methyltransferase [Candidatus Omnitrophota bacterium]
MEHKHTTSPFITVRNSTIHGRGVFAKIPIPKGTRIIEYVGEKITKKEADRRAHIPLNKHKEDQSCGAVYLFELNKRHDIDGNVSYNTARHINHSCEPNAETEIIRGKIWIIALRDIAKDEEIVYNYSYGYEDYHEHRCYCRANQCVGYILAEEHWPKLKK